MLGQSAAAEAHFTRAVEALLVDSMLDSTVLQRSPWLVDALKNLRWAAQARNVGRSCPLRNARKSCFLHGVVLLSLLTVR